MSFPHLHHAMSETHISVEKGGVVIMPTKRCICTGDYQSWNRLSFLGHLDRTKNYTVKAHFHRDGLYHFFGTWNHELYGRFGNELFPNAKLTNNEIQIEWEIPYPSDGNFNSRPKNWNQILFQVMLLRASWETPMLVKAWNICNNNGLLCYEQTYKRFWYASLIYYWYSQQKNTDKLYVSDKSTDSPFQGSYFYKAPSTFKEFYENLNKSASISDCMHKHYILKERQVKFLKEKIAEDIQLDELIKLMDNIDEI